MFPARDKFRLLLFGLLLTTAACSKKKDPEPKLEGTWTVQYTERTEMNRDGSVRSTSTDNPVAPTTYTFTSSELKIVEGSRSNAYPYTREESILRCQHTLSGTSFDIIVAKLATSELLLEQTSGYSSTSYTKIITHLTR